MHQFAFLLTPLLGCLIGYVTNSLAVKMLFRPYRPLRIGKFRIPFTPGMIPKRQRDLSVSMGRMVQEHLLTSEEIQNRLLSPGVRSAITAEISAGFFSAMREATIHGTLEKAVGAPRTALLEDSAARHIGRHMLAELDSMDLQGMLIREIGPFLEKNLGALAALFMNGKAVESISGAAADRIREVLASDGERILRPLVENEIRDFSSRRGEEFLVGAGLSPGQLQVHVDKLFEQIVVRDLGNALEALDVASIVEDRINRMDVRELELLITSIMKRELNAIINLGALIGFLLGCFSLLF